LQGGSSESPCPKIYSSTRENSYYHIFNTDYDYADGRAENSTTNLISNFNQSYGGDSVLSYDYSYDSNGNITEIRQNGELELINKYSYDTSYGNFLLPYEVTLLYFLHFAD
jgi:hypothetical protein